MIILKKDMTEWMKKKLLQIWKKTCKIIYTAVGWEPVISINLVGKCWREKERKECAMQGFGNMKPVTKKLFAAVWRGVVWILCLAGAAALGAFFVLHYGVYRNQNDCIRACLAAGGGRSSCVFEVCD